MGRVTAGLFQFIGELLLLFVDTLKFVGSGAVNLRHTVYQMSVIGVNSLPIVMITVGFSGMVLALYTAVEFLKIGSTKYVGGLVGLSVAREIAPVITAVVVAARVGSAIAAELGTMRVTEQIDALRALATSPVEYLVVPRFLASVFMMPVLGVFALVTGVVGGYLVAVYVGVPAPSYILSVRKLVELQDVVTGLVKTVPFAVIISMVGCHQGLYTAGGAAGVGRATTSSVVLCVILIYAADFFLSSVLPR